jgi:hypothetical protein
MDIRLILFYRKFSVRFPGPLSTQFSRWSVQFIFFQRIFRRADFRYPVAASLSSTPEQSLEASVRAQGLEVGIVPHPGRVDRGRIGGQATNLDKSPLTN